MTIKLKKRLITIFETHTAGQYINAIGDIIKEAELKAEIRGLEKAKKILKGEL